MVEFTIVFSKIADQDAQKLKAAGLKDKCQKLLEILKSDPYQNPPPFEKLTGNLDGYYSRRINIKHRLVYRVVKSEKIVKVLRMWTHYGE